MHVQDAGNTRRKPSGRRVPVHVAVCELAVTLCDGDLNPTRVHISGLVMPPQRAPHLPPLFPTSFNTPASWLTGATSKKKKKQSYLKTPKSFLELLLICWFVLASCTLVPSPASLCWCITHFLYQDQTLSSKWGDFTVDFPLRPQPHTQKVVSKEYSVIFKFHHYCTTDIFQKDRRGLCWGLPGADTFVLTHI